MWNLRYWIWSSLLLIGAYGESALLETLETATRGEIYLLSHKPLDGDGERFLVAPMKEEREILEGVPLTEEDFEFVRGAFLEELAKETESVGMYKHMPIHAIRFYDANGAVVYETSICWMCRNIYVPEEGTARWREFYHRELKKFFMRQLPIPPEVIMEFRAKMGM